MSAEKCIICGVSGTSTRRCCGNNKEYQIKKIDEKILKLKDQIKDLRTEKNSLKREKS